MKAKEYQKLVKQETEARPLLKNFLWAFIIGGSICLVGQIILNLARMLENTEGEARAVTLAAMIFIGTILTGLGIYDELAEFGGAGAGVPITGFANSVTSAAMDYRREGFIQGMSAQIFSVAGPVIVVGILSGFFVALIKFIFKL